MSTNRFSTEAASTRRKTSLRASGLQEVARVLGADFAAECATVQVVPAGGDTVEGGTEEEEEK